MVITRTNIVSEILKHLESNILSGVWKPGDKIDPENSLSEQLNVSRASIHMAIQQMVALGVLESRQGRGTFVKSISILEIQNRLDAVTKSVTLRKMMEFRIILEGEICRRMAPYIRRETLDEMYRCIEGMLQNVGNPEMTSLFDLRFHSTLVASTQNEIIIQSHGVIGRELERTHVIGYGRDREFVEEVAGWHTRITDCLRDGDGEGARESLILHLSRRPCEPPFNTESAATVVEGLFSLK